MKARSELHLRLLDDFAECVFCAQEFPALPDTEKPLSDGVSYKDHSLTPGLLFRELHYLRFHYPDYIACLTPSDTTEEEDRAFERKLLDEIEAVEKAETETDKTGGSVADDRPIPIDQQKEAGILPGHIDSIKAPTTTKKTKSTKTVSRMTEDHILQQVSRDGHLSANDHPANLNPPTMPTKTTGHVHGKQIPDILSGQNQAQAQSAQLETETGCAADISVIPDDPFEAASATSSGAHGSEDQPNKAVETSPEDKSCDWKVTEYTADGSLSEGELRDIDDIPTESPEAIPSEPMPTQDIPSEPTATQDILPGAMTNLAETFLEVDATIASPVKDQESSYYVHSHATTKTEAQTCLEAAFEALRHKRTRWSPPKDTHLRVSISPDEDPPGSEETSQCNETTLASPGQVMPDQSQSYWLYDQPLQAQQSSASQDPIPITSASPIQPPWSSDLPFPPFNAILAFASASQNHSNDTTLLPHEASGSATDFYSNQPTDFYSNQPSQSTESWRHYRSVKIEPESNCESEEPTGFTGILSEHQEPSSVYLPTNMESNQESTASRATTKTEAGAEDSLPLRPLSYRKRTQESRFSARHRDQDHRQSMTKGWGPDRQGTTSHHHDRKHYKSSNRSSKPWKSAHGNQPTRFDHQNRIKDSTNHLIQPQNFVQEDIRYQDRQELIIMEQDHTRGSNRSPYKPRKPSLDNHPTHLPSNSHDHTQESSYRPSKPRVKINHQWQSPDHPTRPSSNSHKPASNDSVYQRRIRSPSRDGKSGSGRRIVIKKESVEAKQAASLDEIRELLEMELSECRGDYLFSKFRERYLDTSLRDDVENLRRAMVDSVLKDGTWLTGYIISRTGDGDMRIRKEKEGYIVLDEVGEDKNKRRKR